MRSRLLSIVAPCLALAGAAASAQTPPRKSTSPPPATRPVAPARPQAPPRTAAGADGEASPQPIAARLVSREAFEQLAARRVPPQRAPRRGRAPGGAGAGSSPPVGGATLAVPLPAGTPRVDSRRPAGDIAALGGLLELRGSNLGAANVKVRHAGQELTVIERHPTLLLCALPAGTGAALTGKLELSSGVATVSGWATLHGAFRLVPEGELTPRAEITSISDGPVGPDGLPYGRTRYTTEVTFHEVPGNVVDEFTCKLFVPEIFQKDLVVTREFGFNSFQVSIPEAELPGGSRAYVECDFRTSRAGVPGSVRYFQHVTASSDVAERASYTIDTTHALRDVLDFEAKEFFGLTQGTSQGLAGPIAVGLLELQGDLAFRVATAPPGAYAVWVSSLVPLRNGWRVEEMKWEESVVHPPGVQPLAEVLRKHDGNGFVFDIAQKYVGWKSLDMRTLGDDAPLVKFARHFVAEDFTKTANPSPYDTQNRRFVRPFRVALRARPSATNDHRATARLESVTLSGPQGADWRDAFEPGIPYDEGRWLVGTMHPATY